MCSESSREREDSSGARSSAGDGLNLVLASRMVDRDAPLVCAERIQFSSFVSSNLDHFAEDGSRLVQGTPKTRVHGHARTSRGDGCNEAAVIPIRCSNVMERLRLAMAIRIFRTGYLC